MEEFFKDLFFDFSSRPSGNTKAAAAYMELIDIYVRVIRETTDWMNEDNRTGAPVGRLISHLVEGSDAVTLLTFNQDLVLENEIYKRARLRSRWCIDHGYGAFSDHVKMFKTKARSFGRHDGSCDRGARLKLLKLHGSLNWQVKMRGERPSPKILSGTAPTPSIRVTRRRKVPQKLLFAGKEGRGWYMWPVIVPPIYNKQALIQRLLPQVWDDAQADLLDCERIIFFGYSLPPTDIEAEMLFQRAIHANENLATVEVINPNPEAAARYARLAPSMPLRWYPGVSAFLAGGP